MASCALPLLLGLWAARAADHDEVSLLQLRADMPERMDALAPLAHHWPHIRGHPGEYGVTKYPMDISSSGNLSDSLLWSKYVGEHDVVLGSVIDHERNIYVASATGLVKLSPEGGEVWKHPAQALSSVLVGNAVCGQTGVESRAVYCLSLKTGKEFWNRTVFPIAGLGGNQMEANRGVIMVAAGKMEIPGLSDMTGVANDRVIGLNASTGDELWQFKVSCGMWMFMGLFPDEDTTLFMDQCGGVYRLGLFNGSLIWYTPGTPGTLSDGAAVLGPDGSAYSCSMAEGTTLADNNNPHSPGMVRKFRLSDGAVLWTATTPYPCTNIPAVTADGGTLVVAPGAIPLVDGPFYWHREEIRSLPREGREALHASYEAMRRNNTLRSFFGMQELTGALMGLDTRTGEVRWRHEVPPSGSIQSAGDEARNWRAFIERGLDSMGAADIVEMLDDPTYPLAHCGPAHWTAPTLDLDGRVYIGDSMGEIRVYDPTADRELDFHLHDGFMPTGPASAPGLMVFTSCQTVWAFKAQGA